MSKKLAQTIIGYANTSARMVRVIGHYPDGDKVIGYLYRTDLASLLTDKRQWVNLVMLTEEKLVESQTVPSQETVA